MNYVGRIYLHTTTYKVYIKKKSLSLLMIGKDLVFISYKQSKKFRIVLIKFSLTLSVPHILNCYEIRFFYASGAGDLKSFHHGPLLKGS